MNPTQGAKGKALLTVILSFGMMFAVMSPASAARATFSITNYVSGSIETSIKFGSKDCINVPITYKASNSLGWPNYFISLHIRKKLGVENTGGFAAIELGRKGFLGGGDPYRGKKNVKLCRVAGYTDDEGDQIPVTKPGTYYFQATLIQVRPSIKRFDSKAIKLTISK